MQTNNKRGGKRKGAGRPKQKAGMQLHSPRPKFPGKYPLHVNMKIINGLPNLRTKKRFQLIKRAILKSRKKGLNIIHFCIQKNHIHLLLEVSNKQKLGRGMQSFCTSLAKSINNSIKRNGQVFIDRYHLHILKTPLEVKNALRYIFINREKHLKRIDLFDKFSTLICFNEIKRLGLSRLDPREKIPNQSLRDLLFKGFSELIVPARTWLLREGWHRVCKSN